MFMAVENRLQSRRTLFMGCCGARRWPIYLPTSAAVTGRSIASLHGNRRGDMLRKSGWLSAGLAVMALSAVTSLGLGASSAQAAVVYCKTAGVPQGCVVRPTPVAAAVVATPAVGVVGVGARGVGVRPGTPLNRGGPVNRVGRR
jgi:hypothetical protein